MKEKACGFVSLIVCALALAMLASGSLLAQQVRGCDAVSIVVDARLERPSQHGLKQLIKAFQLKGIRAREISSLRKGKDGCTLVVGPRDSKTVRTLAEAANVALPEGKEALRVGWFETNGKEVLLVSGADTRGLTYALLGVAQQIRLSDRSEVLESVLEADEKPSVVERTLSKWVMNQSEFERYFYSEEYWDRYFTMLAQDRFNTFLLVFGWGSQGYFDPPYPFFFDVKEFPEIRVAGISKQKQQQNLKALNRMIEIAHDWGLDVRIGIWTHIYRGDQEWRTRATQPRPIPGKVFGLTDDNLVPFTEAALAKFLRLVPGLDSLHFRVHIESSVALPQQIDFWKTVLGVVKENRPGILVDMRAKGYTDDLIEATLATGVNIRLTTKYWGENMGLPFHPTHIIDRNQYKRRHSYADLLRYPRKYKMHWRLWNIGTTRLLLWGDPDYARRFTESTFVWDGEGFEVHEPLAYKMGGHFGELTYDILKPEYQYYDWEFERYWHFYQVFGRLGYNLKSPSEVWRAEFESRFGKEAAPYVEKALHRASRVLPRIIAYNLIDLSAGRTWAEKGRWDDLPVYITALPSDTAQFLGIEEAARYHLKGQRSAKRWPQQTSEWFAATAREVERLVEEAERRIGTHKNKEFVSTIVDLKVLAGLARYHSRRIHAGVNLALFEKTNDRAALNAAIEYEQRAINAWKEIVEVTNGVYADNLLFGRRQVYSGHWRDELVELKRGLEELKKQRRNFGPALGQVVARFDFGDGPLEEGYQRVSPKDNYDVVKGGYGWLHSHLLPSPAWSKATMANERERNFVYGPPPMRYTYSAFAVDLPNGKYELTFSIGDRSQLPRDFGPMWIVAQGKASTERFEVPAGQLVHKRLITVVANNRLNVVFNSRTDSHWLVNGMEVRRAEPVIAHVPVRKVNGKEDVVIRATVAGPEEIESVRLAYGRKAQGYEYVQMKPVEAYLYEARIQRSKLVDGMSYFIQARESSGYTASYPGEGSLKPIRLRVSEDSEAPKVVHRAIAEASPGRPLRVTAEVTDPSGVKTVLLRYRAVSQHQDFRTLEMLPVGGNRYQAEIPGWDISPKWDLMYYLEVFDKYDNGAIYPDLDKETPYIVVPLGGAQTSE